MNNLEDVVLSYPRLKQFMDKTRTNKQEILSMLDGIKANVSPRLINFGEKFLDIIFPKIYDGLDFDENGVDVVELFKNNTVVFVPNHQSHADYIAISYALFKKYNSTIYVAGGDNLNIFPLGSIFRKCACFFIKRVFPSETYRLTVEAYLYYLIKNKYPIEFFFEGGRSRTGKLRSPRFGLYRMLIDAYSHIDDTSNKLVFVPISIAHEYIAEMRLLSEELSGKKKQKESSKQLLSLFKLFMYRFGNIHIKLGRPSYVQKKPYGVTTREDIYNLAFDCFRQVGANMVITPGSLLSMILLDEPSGALAWKDIIARAKSIIQYCIKYNLPITNSLYEDNYEATIKHIMDIFIGNKKIDIIGDEGDNIVYYSVKQSCRAEMLYLKNMIIHHFIVPCIINMAWIDLFRGELNNVTDIKNFFITQRRLFIKEFYLPTTKEFFLKTIKIISNAIGREVNSLEELVELSSKEKYDIVKSIGLFGCSLTYIIESYYVSLKALQKLSNNFNVPVKYELFKKRVPYVFKEEQRLGRLVRRAEAKSMITFKNSIDYFSYRGLISENEGEFKFINPEGLHNLIEKYQKDLTDFTMFTIRM